MRSETNRIYVLKEKVSKKLGQVLRNFIASGKRFVFGVRKTKRETIISNPESMDSNKSRLDRNNQKLMP